MNKRPLSITLISCLFIAAGAMGIVYHAAELKEIVTTPEVTLVLAVRLVAIIGGVCTLRGANWARWGLVAWIAFQVIISFSHTSAELVMHVVVMIITMVAFFHPKASAFFRNEHAGQ
jgi:hypothetical protein